MKQVTTEETTKLLSSEEYDELEALYDAEVSRPLTSEEFESMRYLEMKKWNL